MSKRDNILFIKYVHTCIQDYETQVAAVRIVDSTTEKIYITELFQRFTEKFPSDPLIQILFESELYTYNELVRANKKDQELIISFLKEIDLKDSVDANKSKTLGFLKDLSDQNRFYYQLSGVLHKCIQNPI